MPSRAVRASNDDLVASGVVLQASESVLQTLWGRERKSDREREIEREGEGRERGREGERANEVTHNRHYKNTKVVHNSQIRKQNTMHPA